MTEAFMSASWSARLVIIVTLVLAIMIAFTILQQLMREWRNAPVPRHYPVIATLVPSEKNDRRYAVTLENRTEDELADGSIDMRWILHPGKFSGLDDTHMPDNIWVPAPIRFARLQPGKRLTFDVDGYDKPKEYDGPRFQSAQLLARRLRKGRNSDTPEPIEVQVVMTWAK